MMKTRVATLLLFSVLSLLLAPVSFGKADHSKNWTDAAGKRQGPWEFTAQMLGADEFNNPGKVIMRGYYIDSKPHGCWERQHIDGNVTETCFEDSTDVAVVRCFYADRNMLFETRYRGNLHEGPAKIYYPNGGKLMAEITWTNGRISGPMKTYYASGKVYEEGIWVNDRFASDYKIYNENGMLKREVIPPVTQ